MLGRELTSDLVGTRSGALENLIADGEKTEELVDAAVFFLPFNGSKTPTCGFALNTLL